MSSRSHTKAKKGVDTSVARQRREAASMSIRKDKREENLMKRRQVAPMQAWGGENEHSTNEESKNSTNNHCKYQIIDIPQMVRDLRSTDVDIQIANIKGFRRLLSAEKNPPVQECIDNNALPIFVEYLNRTDIKELQFEAAWALTNIASTDRTNEVVNCKNAVSSLVKCLLSEHPEVRDQVAWCLGNIAGDSPKLRDEVLAVPGAMEGLLQNIANPENLLLMRNCTWTLSNFCRGKPQPPMNIIQPCLPALKHLLYNCNDEPTMIDACWALSYISDGDNDRINSVISHDIIPCLLQMIASDQSTQITPALRTIGNIVSGDDKCTQAVVDAGFCSYASKLLEHPKKNIRKETCWALSNIAAGSENQLKSMMSFPNLIRGVIEGLSESSEWDVRKEAAWVVSNITTGGDNSHIINLVDNDVIPPLCDLLEVGDSRIILVGLEALEHILNIDLITNKTDYAAYVEDCGGIERLESLQEHKNNDVYEKVVKIIEKYFGGEDEAEDQNVAPQITNNGQYSFGNIPPVPLPKFASNEYDFSSQQQEKISTPFATNIGMNQNANVSYTFEM